MQAYDAASAAFCAASPSPWPTEGAQVADQVWIISSAPLVDRECISLYMKTTPGAQGGYPAVYEIGSARPSSPPGGEANSRNPLVPPTVRTRWQHHETIGPAVNRVTLRNLLDDLVSIVAAPIIVASLIGALGSPVARAMPDPPAGVESDRAPIPLSQPSPPGAASLLTPEILELLRRDPPAAALKIRERANSLGADLHAAPRPISDSDFIVHTERGSFVPAAGAHDLTDFEAGPGRVDGSGTPMLVQLARHLSLEESLALLDRGGRYLEAMGDSTVLFLIPTHAARSVAELPFVRWAGAFRPEYKFDNTKLGDAAQAVYVRVAGDDDPSYLEDLRSLGHADASRVQGHRFYLLPSASRQEVGAIARLGWVLAVSSVPEEIPESVVNFGAMDDREFLMVSRYHGLGRTGAGVKVGVRDSGCLSTHGDLNGIFVAGSEFGSPENHGTHVTAIIAGRGVQSGGSIVGVAPGSSILFRDYASGATFDDLDALRGGGANISNHSYQYAGCTFYEFIAGSFDQYMDDYGQLYVISAGNENGAWGNCNGTHDSVTNPAVAKNVIAVGALSFTEDGSTGFGRVAPYSSPGPTGGLYHRLKPDLVAPGGDADSGPGDPNWPHGVVASYAQVGTSWDQNLWPDYTPSYVRAIGTSMASPHTAGALALLRQWSPASTPEGIKAQLIAMALPVKDNDANAPLNGYASLPVGYGLVNPYQSMYSIPGEWQTLLWSEGTLTLSHREDSVAVTIPAGARKVIVALAYNDVEGNAGNLNDDVDFEITLPSGARYSSDSNGNLGCGSCVSRPLPAGVDTESPVEKVVIENPSPADLGAAWTIRTRLTAWPSSCVPPGCVTTEAYGLVVAAVYKTPALDLEVAQTSFASEPGQNVTVSFNLRNTGGYIIPATVVSLDAPNVSRFLGGLAGTNDSLSGSLTLAAPALEGVYTYTLRGEGPNLGLADATRTIDLLVDGTPPAGAQMSYPAPDGSVCADSLTVRGTASDSSGTIQRVEFYLDSEPSPVCTDAASKPSGSTFECSFDPRSRPVGAHCLKARGCDRVDHCVVSSPVCFTLTYPGASEINDGIDNQCPGEDGYGAVDEVSGVLDFAAAPDFYSFTWPPQAGATSYEVIRSDFSTFPTCTSFTTTSASVVDPALPGPELFFYYLVRATAPFVGSWGQDWTGIERVPTCQ